eukprot:984596-Rhodomonas_salina.1
MHTYKPGHRLEPKDSNTPMHPPYDSDLTICGCRHHPAHRPASTPTTSSTSTTSTTSTTTSSSTSTTTTTSSTATSISRHPRARPPQHPVQLIARRSSVTRCSALDSRRCARVDPSSQGRASRTVCHCCGRDPRGWQVDDRWKAHADAAAARSGRNVDRVVVVV